MLGVLLQIKLFSSTAHFLYKKRINVTGCFLMLMVMEADKRPPCGSACGRRTHFPCSLCLCSKLLKPNPLRNYNDPERNKLTGSAEPFHSTCQWTCSCFTFLPDAGTFWAFRNVSLIRSRSLGEEKAVFGHVSVSSDVSHMKK